jgi:hypothetical protein
MRRKRKEYLNKKEYISCQVDVCKIMEGNSGIFNKY